MALPSRTSPSPDAVALGRRERERLARRQAMLDAALAVFGEKGFEGATLDEIAERAEFGKGTLYNYFPGGKDEIYNVLFEERVIGGLFAVLDRSVPADRPMGTPAEARTAFHDLILGLLRHFEADRSVHRLFLTESPRVVHDPDRMAFVFGLFSRFMDAVAEPIARAVASGALRPLPPRAVAHLLLGNVRGMLMAHVAAGCPATDCAPAGAPPPVAPAEAADFITTVLFDGLLAPRATDV